MTGGRAMNNQIILRPAEDYREVREYLLQSGAKTILLVCSRSAMRLPVAAFLERFQTETGVRIVPFSDFRPNPLYESVAAGVELFRREGCELIFAVGGGSAMDVAKCIKLYANMSPEENYLRQTIVPNDIPLLAMPTTAGTGSEATRYAVIYYNGEKQSVTDESCIPGAVLLDPSCLKTLPPYQKKATMCDALCHAVESFWSVNSTEESRALSLAAIRAVTENMDGYLANTDAGNAGMLLAAHTAGRAINITQTTAGHAMCYKLTSLFGCAHGHAAMLCVRVLYPWMVRNVSRCTDPRGEAALRAALDGIAAGLGCADAAAGAERLGAIFDALELEIPAATPEEFSLLRDSVNPVRLKNHPIALDTDTIDALYHEILKEKRGMEA